MSDDGELMGLDALTEGMIVANEILHQPGARIVVFAETKARTWLLVTLGDGRRYLVVIPRRETV